MTEHALPDPNEPPEDVASLYSWANLHGGKYRDFSASRAEIREKARQRTEEAIEEERLRVHREAEAQPAAETARALEELRRREMAAQQGAQLAAQEAAQRLDRSDGASKNSIASKSDASSRPAIRSTTPARTARDTSPEALAKIQAADQKMIDMVAKELEPQAHFVSYAPPAMVAFRKGVYLEFSVGTTLPDTAAGSRYKMAALAFDDHISHLVRPMMAYFKGDLDFDGLAFSTSIHQGDKTDAHQSGEAVEFFFPTDALRCYEAYDCTGQQLIDQGSVLINGERVSLDLQLAEASER